MQQFFERKASWLILVVGLVVSVTILFGGRVLAQQKNSVTFPVAALGGCESKTACKTYCDDPVNVEACVVFAERHRLISSSEAAENRKFIGLREGPGGCRGAGACKAYCEDVSHIDECVAFAEAHDLLGNDELKEARGIRAALKAGVELPGGCTNKAECKAYCEDEAHSDECVAFGEKAGFINKEQAAIARKTMGHGPGDCRGREQCETYCHNEANFDECLAFAEKYNLIPPDEAERARKTGGKGPGGCRGSECAAYCNQEAHAEECLKFAQENGLLKDEDVRRMEEGRMRLKQVLTNAPEEVANCLKAAVGEDVLAKIEPGTFVGGPELGETMRACFASTGLPAGEGMRERMNPPMRSEDRGSSAPFEGNSAGPGGCRTAEACKAYCVEHPDECKSMQAPVGEHMIERKPPFGTNMEKRILEGPKGCVSADECRKVCESEPELCKDFKAALDANKPGMRPMSEGQRPPCNSPEECEKLREQMMMQRGVQPPFEGERMPAPGTSGFVDPGINGMPPQGGEREPGIEEGSSPAQTTTVEPVSVISPRQFLASVFEIFLGLFR